MNVLSLFDGISCGRIALDRAKINYDNYFASEIDKYAIQIAQKNYPNTIHIGDVKNIRKEQLPIIHLLIGGSPCVGFSNAGKRLNFEDPQSKLFFEYIRLLEELKPKYFLLENVKMKKEWQDIISEIIGVTPIEINSSLVSAQNRVRLYWTNIPVKKLPEDRKIYISDILEDEVDEKYYINTINEINWVCNKKNADSPIRLINIGKGGQAERVYYVNAKSTTLNSTGGGMGGKTGLYLVAQRGRNIVDGKRKDILGAKTIQRLETRIDEKTNTITTVQKDNYLVIEIENEYYRIRKLTPLECERLQTISDNFTEGISDSQRYKCVGNAWTVDIIGYLLSHIKDNK